MIERKRLIFNTALLTGSSLLMSLIAMTFQVWLAGKIGAKGIGLYELCSSVRFLAMTIAVSGIRFAATRLISEELAGRDGGAVKAAMRRCFLYALFFGLVAMAALKIFAEPIGFLWIGDARCVQPLRLIAVSMPFIALSSVMSGYFTACTRVWKPTLVHFLEQCVTIALVALFLKSVADGDIESACSVIMRASVAGDVFSFILMALFYLDDRHACSGAGSTSYLTSRMLHIALPLALSSYARSALSTLEHILVPRGLKASGFSADMALADYGTIQGMVFPLLSFPACFLAALAELIVPELTRAQVQKDTALIRSTVSGLIKKGLGYSVTVALLIFFFSDRLAVIIYSSPEAGDYLKLLCPLIPVMYTDLLTDACLKGLGQQVWNMGINVLDAALAVLLVWRLLPVFALKGYIFILYFNECLNFALSSGRLLRVLKP